MTAAELIAELTRRGIRLETAGDRLRYSPRSALTPDLAAQMKAHKAELLVLLNAEAVWQAALDELESDPDFPAELVRALRLANVEWETE